MSEVRCALPQYVWTHPFRPAFRTAPPCPARTDRARCEPHPPSFVRRPQSWKPSPPRTRMRSSTQPNAPWTTPETERPTRGAVQTGGCAMHEAAMVSSSSHHDRALASSPVDVADNLRPKHAPPFLGDSIPDFKSNPNQSPSKILARAPHLRGKDSFSRIRGRRRRTRVVERGKHGDGRDDEPGDECGRQIGIRQLR